MQVISRVRIKFDKYWHNTGRAILIQIGTKEHWLPLGACRNLVVNKKLGGHVEIPANLADEKGIYYDDRDATLIMEHHTPTKLDKSKIKHDDNLTR